MRGQHSTRFGRENKGVRVQVDFRVASKPLLLDLGPKVNHVGENGLALVMKIAMNLSLPVQIALGLTLLTILPGVVMSVSPFLRITIVLHFLRQALGTQTAPSKASVSLEQGLAPSADHAVILVRLFRCRPSWLAAGAQPLSDQGAPELCICRSLLPF